MSWPVVLLLVGLIVTVKLYFSYHSTEPRA